MRKIGKNEIKDLGPTIYMSRNMKREFKKYITELKILLKDDTDYADFLVQQILSIGYGVYIDSLIMKIYDKFQAEDIPSDAKAQKIIKLQSELIGIVHVLSRIIDGDYSVREQWKELEEEDQNIYLDKLREEIRDEVNKIYYNNNENVDLIG